jgi:hypothetical protein
MNDKKNSMGENTSTVQYNEANDDLNAVLSKPVNSRHHAGYSRPQDSNQIYGVIVGEIFTVADEVGDQKIFVNYPGNPYTTPLLALTTIKLNSADSGKQVVLSFDQGNPLRPIITGVLQNSEAPPIEELALDVSKELGANQVKAKIDDDQVTLSAGKEIVLQCGKSSITLTKAGKIIIRGEYLLSRATGVNKIKGGSVQIN